MKNLFSIIFTLLIVSQVQAQIAINNDNSNPDASSILDIKSTDKGVLIPRMSAAQRDLISSPATGLLLYINDDNSFYFYNGTAWTQLSADNLGNHTASQNLQLNGNYLSNDGDNEGLFVDADGKVGIGTNTPIHNLDITSDQNSSVLNIQTFDDVRLPLLRFARATGSQASPTAVGNGNNLGGFSCYGYDGTDFTLGGSIRIVGEDTWTSSSHPTYIKFETNSISGIFEERLVINSSGQVVIKNDANTSLTVDASALLDLQSTDKGLLIPRMTTSERNNISSPANGLMVFDTDLNEFWWYKTGTGWGNLINTLSLSGNTLSNGSGNTIDLSSYVNTDAQDLSISGNTLTLTNDGSTVDLSAFDQDLTLSTNTLSLTNSGVDIDLSGYLDNTDAQDLSISGNTLSLTGDGTTVSLSKYLDADDLGNHVVGQNLELGPFFLSSDGDDEGLLITSTGDITATHNFMVVGGLITPNLPNGFGINVQ